MTVRFHPRINQRRGRWPSQSDSIKLGGKHGSLWKFSRMGERMNALGTAQVTTWGLACGPSLIVTTHQNASNAPTHTQI